MKCLFIQCPKSKYQCVFYTDGLSGTYTCGLFIVSINDEDSISEIEVLVCSHTLSYVRNTRHSEGGRNDYTIAHTKTEDNSLCSSGCVVGVKVY